MARKTKGKNKAFAGGCGCGGGGAGGCAGGCGPGCGCAGCESKWGPASSHQGHDHGGPGGYAGSFDWGGKAARPKPVRRRGLPSRSGRRPSATRRAPKSYAGMHGHAHDYPDGGPGWAPYRAPSGPMFNPYWGGPHYQCCSPTPKHPGLTPSQPTPIPPQIDLDPVYPPGQQPVTPYVPETPGFLPGTPYTPPTTPPPGYGLTPIPVTPPPGYTLTPVPIAPPPTYGLTPVPVAPTPYGLTPVPITPTPTPGPYFAAPQCGQGYIYDPDARACVSEGFYVP